jgi:hypothetical protein
VRREGVSYSVQTRATDSMTYVRKSLGGGCTLLGERRRLLAAAELGRETERVSVVGTARRDKP